MTQTDITAALRRTAAAPQWVYDNTYKNATRATLENDGLTVKGAYGGVAFPIPQSGLEVHWNHMTLWRGEATHTKYKVWTTTADGKQVLATAAVDDGQYPYYYQDGSLESTPNPNYMLANGVLYTSTEGEIVHFRFDNNARGDGWMPDRNAVACDHFTPSGTVFELMGSAPEMGAWNAPIPAVDVGDPASDIALAMKRCERPCGLPCSASSTTMSIL